MTYTPYFTYSVHPTMFKAEAALEDYFASGEISEGERPFIRPRFIAPSIASCSRRVEIWPFSATLPTSTGARSN